MHTHTSWERRPGLHRPRVAGPLEDGNRRGFIATSTALILAATAATTAGGAIASSKIQAGAAKRASQAEQSAIDKQLEWEREKEAERKAEWDRAQEDAKAQFEASQAEDVRRYDLEYGVREAEFELAKQKYRDRQTQMAPYRAAGQGALAALVGRSGGTMAAPAPAAGGATPSAEPLLEKMPENWQPGDPVTKTSAAPALKATVEEPVAPAGEGAILPPTLAESQAATVAPTLSAPTMSAMAYQSLAGPRSSGRESLTPEQVAALVQAGKGSSLASLAQARRARV